jgi:cytochrome c oxidase cbb3-type subunit 3
MPTKVEKDAATGQMTTGHEWDGIKELNTPLPKWWLYVFYATCVYALIWWVLYPSWPWINTYFGGVLGYDQREALEERVADAEAARSEWVERLREAPLEEIPGDAELMTVAFTGGEAAFNDNCAPCHGLGGAGQGFYPSLADDAWIWGGSLDAIHHTISYGIRNDHPDTRFNMMPAYGADGILEREQISEVANYVLSLSGEAPDAEAADAGAAIFAEQCAACHGEGGEGMPDLGAPNLSDQIWLYGGTEEEVVAQIRNPRHGVMPPWVGRLDPETIKSLAVYVHALGGGE